MYIGNMRLIRDPEYVVKPGVNEDGSPRTVKYFRSSAAINDGAKEDTLINIQAFDEVAEFMHKHFKKGDVFAATAKLVCNSWTDEEGNPRKIFLLQIINAQFVMRGRKAPEKESAVSDGNAGHKPSESTPEELADIEAYRESLNNSKTAVPFM